MSLKNLFDTDEERASAIKKLEDNVFYSPDGCWYWVGGYQSKGYGFVRFGGKYILTHRASYILYKGDIPNGLLVCHSCDNPKCLNPHHLFLGTPKDNMDDMARKNRAVKFKGEQHYFAKLNNLSIKVIREAVSSGYLQKDIARYFKVHRSMISSIKLKKNWAHI